MPDLTTNYGLKKPLSNEYCKPDDFNYNADAIDAALKGLDDKIVENDTSESTWQTITLNNFNTLIPNDGDTYLIPYSTAPVSHRFALSWDASNVDLTLEYSGIGVMDKNGTIVCITNKGTIATKNSLILAYVRGEEWQEGDNYYWNTITIYAGFGDDGITIRRDVDYRSGGYEVSLPNEAYATIKMLQL